MVEIAWTHHQDFFAASGHGKRGCNKGLITARCDMRLFRCDRRIIKRGKMRCIGIAEPVITLNPAIACRIRCGRRISQRLQHIRMCRIAGNRLAHVDQGTFAAIIGSTPIKNDRNRGSGKTGDRGIEHSSELVNAV